MTPREISALVSTILVIVGTVWYIYLVVTGTKVKPVLATWIVTSCGTILSFATYWTSPKHSLVSNAYNAISIVTINAILIATAWKNRKDGVVIRFNGFQKVCLGVSSAIAIYWVVLVWCLGGTGIKPNILTQVLMFIGYLITAERLWHAKKNSESLFAWWCILSAGMIALYTGIVSHNGLSILFAARTSFGVALLLWLMHRAERKARITN